MADKKPTASGTDSSSGKVAPDDSTLFREAVGKIRRLRHDRVLPDTPKPRPRRLRSPGDGTPGVDTSKMSDDYLPATASMSFTRPGIQQKTLRRLRQGNVPPQAILDLHGMIVPEARDAVAGFISECQQRGIRRGLVIHGKGLGSQQQPVLKTKLGIWLRQHPEILAFCPAQPRDGGSGAVYILIRQG